MASPKTSRHIIDKEIILEFHTVILMQCTNFTSGALLRTITFYLTAGRCVININYPNNK